MKIEILSKVSHSEDEEHYAREGENNVRAQVSGSMLSNPVFWKCHRHFPLELSAAEITCTRSSA